MPQRFISERRSLSRRANRSAVLMTGNSVRNTAQVPLIAQVVRLLLHLLESVPYADLRFAEREQLKRILIRLTGGIATAQAHLLRSGPTKRQ